MIVDSFNLDSPPGFRGLHPDIPVTVYYRHLPHWRQKGATYFVTFRLIDALPQVKLEYLRQLRDDWEWSHPPPRTEQDWEDYARKYTQCAENWMDEGYGECVFRAEPLAQLMARAFLHFQDQRYSVYCFTVMPNHCHVAVKPLGEYELEEVLASWKGYMGHEVNKQRKRAGALWQEESYDRIVRDEEHLYRVVQYIGRNPAMARLPREQWHRWIHPGWEAAGWRFEDEQLLR